MRVRNFKELLVWQKGIDIVEEVYKVSVLLLIEEKYALRSQLQRAAISIPSNIAEGCGRSSSKALIQFLEYAIGSSFEIQTQLIAAVRLCQVTSEETEHVMLLLQEEGKMLNGFIEFLKNNPS